MVDIYSVSNHFDDIPVTDGYSGAVLFNAQFSNFNDASPDGSTAQRRVISMAPSLSIPTRRVIVALTEMSVVGSGTIEGIYGLPIRQSFWVKKITDNFTKLTPGQAALDSGGTAFYGQKAFFRDTNSTQTTSDLDPFWNIYCSPGEAVTEGQILKTSTAYYRVRSVHLDLSGFTVAECDELDSGSGTGGVRVSVTFNLTGAYNPVTDTYASGSVTVYGILMDRYKWYDLLTPSDTPTLAGDMTLVVATSAVTPVIGKTVTIASRVWQILNMTANSDAWEIHLRRA